MQHNDRKTRRQPLRHELGAETRRARLGAWPRAMGAAAFALMTALGAESAMAGEMVGDTAGGHGAIAAPMAAPASAAPWLLAAGPAATPATAPAVTWIAGEVRRVDARQHTVTLRHERITNLDMDAMTMVFKAKDPALLDGLKPGDKLRFAADMIGGDLVVTAIER